MKTVWRQTTVGDECQFRGGGTPSKAIGRYWQGNIPWVSPKDMKSDVVSDSIDHISQEAIDGSATSIIPQGSVLVVVRSGILARTVPLALTGCDLTINQDLKALCPNKELDAKFLYHVLHSRMGELLSRVSRGATVHRLPTDALKSLAIRVPPLVEQRRIVQVLDEALDALEVARANAERKLDALTSLKAALLDSTLRQKKTD